MDNLYSKLVMPEIKYCIEKEDSLALSAIMEEFFPQDIAELMEDLNEKENEFLFSVLSEELKLEVFSILDYPEQEDIIESLDEKEIKEILNEMAPDDRTELFEDMPKELTKKYIDVLDPEDKNLVEKYMSYPEGSIARLTTPNFIKLSYDFTAAQAIEHIRKNHEEKETIYYSYILNENNQLLGIISLKDLVLSTQDLILKDLISEQNIIKIRADEDQEIGANLMQKYDLWALPVVTSNDTMLGIVTFDDIADVAEEEATEDIHKMAAMIPSEDGYLDNKFFDIFKNRIFWLIVLLVMQTITGMVLKRFSSVLDQVVALSFYIPLLIGTGGNAGTQSSTLVIRGMATGDIEIKDVWKLLRREILLAIIMGILLAILTYARVFYQESDNYLALVVSLGLLATIIASMISGTVLPVIFNLLKLDPALMSGPFISTSIDILGLVIYLEIARLILNL